MSLNLDLVSFGLGVLFGIILLFAVLSLVARSSG